MSRWQSKKKKISLASFPKHAICNQTAKNFDSRQKRGVDADTGGIQNKSEAFFGKAAKTYSRVPFWHLDLFRIANRPEKETRHASIRAALRPTFPAYSAQ